jgi:integrase
MLNIAPKISRSRKKSGHAPWQVDSRYVLKNGSRKFFWTREDALHFINKLEAEASPAADTTDTWKWTFADLCEHPDVGYKKHLKERKKFRQIKENDYRTKKRHAKELLTVIVDGEPLAKMRVADLTKGKVQNQIIKQWASGHTDKTVANYLTSLSVMCEYAISLECRTTNFTHKVKPLGEKRSKSNDKASKILPSVIKAIEEAMKANWKLAFRFACMTGLRQGEQRALTWGQVDLDNLKVHVTQAMQPHDNLNPGDTKTKAGRRVVPLHPELAKELRELFLQQGRPNDPNAYVFPSRVGTPLHGEKFLYAVGAACRKAGVEHVTWHELRHFYASKILQAFPDDLWRVKNYMGHETIDVTQKRYGHWLDENKEDEYATDKLVQHFANVF